MLDTHLALGLREGILRIESGGLGFVVRFFNLPDRLFDLGIDVLGLFLGFFVALFCPGIIFESLLRFKLAVSLLQVVAPGGFHFFFRFGQGVNGSVRGCSHFAFAEEPTPNGPVFCASSIKAVASSTGMSLCIGRPKSSVPQRMQSRNRCPEKSYMQEFVFYRQVTYGN